MQGKLLTGVLLTGLVAWWSSGASAQPNCTGTTMTVANGGSPPQGFLLIPGNCVIGGDKIFGNFVVSGAEQSAGSSTFSWPSIPGNVTVGFQGVVAAGNTGTLDYSVAVNPANAAGFLIDDLQKDFTLNVNTGIGPASATLTGTAAGVAFTCTRSVSVGGVDTSDCPVIHSFAATPSIDVVETLTVGANSTVTALTDTISQVAPGVPEPASLTLLGSALIGLGWAARRRRTV